MTARRPLVIGGTEDHQYVFRIPREDEIPPSWVLVHNQVRPTRHIGSRGFRAWLSPRGDRFELCPCGWASELAEHYRVKGIPDRSAK